MENDGQDLESNNCPNRKPLEDMSQMKAPQQDEEISETANETDIEEDFPLVPFLELDIPQRRQPTDEDLCCCDAVLQMPMSPPPLECVERIAKEEHAAKERYPSLRRGVPRRIIVSPDANQPTQCQEIWIFDPVDQLVQGSLTEILTPHDEIQRAINELERCLKEHLDVAIERDLEDSSSDNSSRSYARGERAVQRACQILKQFPETAQVHFNLLPIDQKKTIDCTSDQNSCGGSVSTSHSLSGSSIAMSNMRVHSSVCRILTNAVCKPLVFFCVTGNLKGVQAAYAAYPEAIADTDEMVGSPLHYACYHATHPEVIQFLLHKYPEGARSTNDFYETPLHLAMKNEHGAIDMASLKLLVEAYPAALQLADATGNTPFLCACEKCGSVEAIKYLMKVGGSAVLHTSNSMMEKPLHVAAARQASQVVEVILQHHPAQTASIDLDGCTPLHRACQSFSVSSDIVNSLLTIFPEAKSMKDHDGHLPLDMALRSCGASPSVLKLLQ